MLEYGLNPKQKFCLLFTFLAALVLSANIAWLNPRPDFAVVKMPKVPILWQYNLDSSGELLAAAYFPEYFRKDPVRISRPTFPLIIHGTSVGLLKLIQPFYPVTPLQTTAVAYFLVKILFYALAMLAGVRILVPRIGVVATTLTLFFLITHSFSLTYLSTFHTTDMQYLIPIFLLFFLGRYVKKPSLVRILFFSFFAGCLVLIKQSHAILIAIWIFGLINRRWREVGTSVFAAVLPYLLWRVYLNHLEIPYYDHQETHYKMGVGFLKEILVSNPISTAKLVLLSIQDFVSSIWLFYNFLLIPILVDLPRFWARLCQEKTAVLLVLCILLTWIQFFAARKTPVGIMASDFALFIFAGASIMLLPLLERYKKRQLILLSLGGLWFFLQVLSLVNFPWVSPYDQPERQVETNKDLT